MRMFALSAGLLLATVPAIAAAQSALAPAAQSAPAPAATTAVKPVEDKKVCRREAATGSILPGRVCHTKAEWAQIDGQNAANAQAAMARRSRSLGTNGN